MNKTFVSPQVMLQRIKRERETQIGKALEYIQEQLSKKLRENRNLTITSHAIPSLVMYGSDKVLWRQIAKRIEKAGWQVKLVFGERDSDATVLTISRRSKKS